MKTILIITGTRPEAIKLAPVILHFREKGLFKIVHCHTNQHRKIAERIFEFFEIEPDFEIDLKEERRTLADLFSQLISHLSTIVSRVRPDAMLVQGDTSSACAGALCGFYEKVPVFHVEAGLRTGEMYEPFPEEVHRKLISSLSTLHFSPTSSSTQNLINENITPAKIIETGNTGIDALMRAINIIKINEPAELSSLKKQLNLQNGNSKRVLITVHRRENIPFLSTICDAIKAVAQIEDTICYFSLHPNPDVRSKVVDALKGHPQIHLMEPPNYPAFVGLMEAVDLILTDSGGIQEEAPYLGTPVVVLRNFTERTEGVESRVARLVKIDPEEIGEAVRKGLKENIEKSVIHIYGDGQASDRIHESCIQYIMQT